MGFSIGEVLSSSRGLEEHHLFLFSLCPWKYWRFSKDLSGRIWSGGPATAQVPARVFWPAVFCKVREGGSQRAGWCGPLSACTITSRPPSTDFYSNWSNHLNPQPFQGVSQASHSQCVGDVVLLSTAQSGLKPMWTRQTVDIAAPGAYC